jgi:putative oxidoreductase
MTSLCGCELTSNLAELSQICGGAILVSINPMESSPVIDARTAPYAALILRVSLGILFLAHAGLKLFVFTPAGTAGFFGSLGLPPALAYITIIVELAAGIGLILGFWTRFAALIGIPILIGAIVTVHGSAGFFFNNPNGGWEFLAFWIAALVAQALLGDGAYALRPTPIGNRLAAAAA